MHPYLLKIPNKMFYNGKINAQYKPTTENRFLNPNTPFMFINCDSKEMKYGTSYCNKAEVKIIVKLIEYLLGRNLINQ